MGTIYVCLALTTLAAQQPPIENVIRSIRPAAPRVGEAAAVAEIEIELYSSREFPVLDQVVVLRIGTRDFLKSRSPDDGSLHTLIFSLPTDVFDSLPDGAALTVRFGKGEPADQPEVSSARGASRLRWDFGTLDKSLLLR